MATSPLAPSGQADGARTRASLRATPIFSLYQFADIQTGYHLKRGLQPGPHGNVELVRASDVSCPLAQPLARVRMDAVPLHHLLQEGDLVFKIRGKSNPAALITAPQGPTICTSTLARIRIRDQARLLPAYLAWLLNSPQTQAMLEQHSLLTRIRVVPARVLKDLDIFVPSMARQRQIAKAHALNLQVIEKENCLREKNRVYAAEALMRLARFE